MIEFDATDATAVAFAIGGQEYCGDEEMWKNGSGDHRSRIDLQLEGKKETG